MAAIVNCQNVWILNKLQVFVFVFQMIKDCMKKVITVNLHQTVKVHHICFNPLALGVLAKNCIFKMFVWPFLSQIASKLVTPNIICIMETHVFPALNASFAQVFWDMHKSQFQFNALSFLHYSYLFYWNG